MPKCIKVVLFIVGLALYLNIGWALGTYTHNNVAYKSVEAYNLFDKFLAGPGHILYPLRSISAKRQITLRYMQVLDSLTWPVILIVISFAWFVYFAYLILWLIFAGGIAKLLGYG